MTAQQLIEDFRAFERSLALRAAMELDLFTRIGAGTGRIPVLASDSRVSQHGISVLCDYLTAQGHLIKQKGRYSLTPNSRKYLASSSPTFIGPAVRFLANNETVKAFCQLRERVKRGGSRTSANGSEWINFAHWMAPLARPVAESMAEVIVTTRGPVTVLDLAAGHGLYGLAVAARNPSAQIFALDSPPVLAVAAENARRAGVGKRWKRLPGDVFKTNFGRLYDLILAANLAHHFDETENIRLFAKCLAALKPGGQLVLVDFVPNPDRVSPVADASFALTMLATTKHGKVYTFKEYSSMLRAAGFSSVRRLDRWVIRSLSPKKIAHP
jgi:SAM-dependent methyltransferase